MAEEQNLPEQTPQDAADNSLHDQDAERRILSDDEIVKIGEPATMVRGDSPQPPEPPPARLQPERIKRKQGLDLIEQLEVRLADMSTSALIWTGGALFIVLVLLGLLLSSASRNQQAVVAVATNTPSPTEALAPVASADNLAPAVFSDDATEIVIAVAGNDEFLADALQNALRAASVAAGEPVVLTVQYAGDGIPTSDGTAQTLREEQSADFFVWPAEDDGQIIIELVAAPEFDTSNPQLDLESDSFPESILPVSAEDEEALETAAFNTAGQLAFLLGDYQAASSLFGRVQSTGLVANTGASDLNALSLYQALSRYTLSGDSPDVLQAMLASFTYQPERLLRELGYTIPGDADGAAAQFEAVLTENPEDIAALVGLARVNIVQGDYASAIDNTATATQIEPTNSDALLLQGAAFYLSGDPLSALERLDQSLEVNIEDEGAYALRALTHIELGQYELALSDFDSALGLQTDIVLLGRAVSLDQLGDLVATLALYQSFFRDYSADANAEPAVNVMLTARIASLGEAVQAEQESAAATQSAAQSRATEAVQLTATAAAGPTIIPFANDAPAATQEP